MTIHPWPIAVLLSFSLSLELPHRTLAQSELTGQAYINWYQDKFLGGGKRQSYTPEEIVPIKEAEARKDDRAVVRGCDEVLKRDPKLFYSLPMADWVKSLAYIERGWAQYRLTKEPKYVIEDEEKAAEFGNLTAMLDVIDKMLGKYQGNESAEFIDASPLEHYLRIGAELGNSEAARMLGTSLWPNPLTDAEKAYWALVAQGATNEESGFLWDYTIHNRYELVNQNDLESVISRLSPLGGLTPHGPHNLPGRGIAATFFADASLRREYGFNFGKRAPATRDASPDALEIYKFHRAVADLIGRADAYLLVPGSRTFADSHMISMNTQELSGLLSPIDVVVVRCGPLTHMVMVYKVNRKASTVSFVDGLFEFWQPSHNSCITTFDLAPFKYGGYLATVPLADILPMIQEVITYRDRAYEHPAKSAGPNYVTLSQFEHSEFFDYFRVSEVVEKDVGPDEKIVRYMTGAFQNKIFFSMKTDHRFRIQEALLSVDRDWVGEESQTNPLANDLVKSFVVAVTPASSADRSRPAAQAIWKSQAQVPCGSDSDSTVSEAFFGKVDRCVIPLASGNLVFANLKDPYFDRALHVIVTTSPSPGAFKR